MESAREAQKRKWLEKIRKIKEMSDIERRHIEADKLLCSILRDCGIDEVVDEFEAMNLWYA